MIRWLADAPAPRSTVRWLGTKPNTLGDLIPQNEHCWRDISGLDATVDSGSGLFNAALILAYEKVARARCVNVHGVDFGPIPGTGNTEFNCCCPENAVIDPTTQTCVCLGATVWHETDRKCVQPPGIVGPKPQCPEHYYVAVVGSGDNQHYECLKDPNDSYWWPKCPDGFFYDPAQQICVDAGKAAPCNPCRNTSSCSWIQKGSLDTVAVKQWQDILIRDVRISGAPFTSADGDFGEATDAATKAWQTAKGIFPDGIVGDVTWAAACVTGAISKPGSGGGSSDNTGVLLVALGTIVALVVALSGRSK